MRVLAVLAGYPPHKRNGALITTHQYLAALAARGHQVRVMCTRHRPPRANLIVDGVEVTGHSHGYGIRWQPDIIVHQMGDAPKAIRFAKSAGKPRVVLAHGHTIRDSSLQGAALVVWNSANLRDASGFKGRDIVCPPPIDPAQYRTTPGDEVTLVSLSEDKGVDTFMRVARRMPDTRLLGVTGLYGVQLTQSAGRLPNVTVIKPSRDMRGDVYSRTRVLLMPSRYETYGRVAIEAMCSGIPVIAHPTPGLVESLGDAATFVERSDVHGWVRAIRRLNGGDGRAWTRASKAALDHASALDPEETLAAFCDRIEECCELHRVPA